MSREAESLVAWWANGGREVAAAVAALPRPRPPFVLASWPNFDFAGLTWNRPPCDRCGHKYAFTRYGARRLDEAIPDGHLSWRTVPLCSACVESLGEEIVPWLVERTCQR